MSDQKKPPSEKAELSHKIESLRALKKAKTITPLQTDELKKLIISRARIQTEELAKRLSKKRRSISESTRAQDAHNKIKLGAYVIAAGLADTDTAILRGALSYIQAVTDPATLRKWREIGGRIFDSEIKNRDKIAPAAPAAPAPAPALAAAPAPAQPAPAAAPAPAPELLIVAFQAAPNPDITNALKKFGFLWDAQSESWRGNAIRSDVTKIISGIGGFLTAETLRRRIADVAQRNASQRAPTLTQKV